MSELFDEVDEDVRRDQLKKLWDQYSIYIIAAALLIIAAVGGWRGYQYLEAKKAAKAGAAFDNAVELSEQNKHAEAEAAFNTLAATAPSGIACWRGCMPRPNSQAAIRKPRPRLYDDISADRSIGATEQELARIRAAGLLVDSASYPSMLQRLEPAAAPGATFRHSARELLALSAWRANDTVGGAAVAGPDCQ